MLSFDDFVKVFDAYSKYVSKAQPQAPQAPQVPQAPQAPQAQDTITQMLTQMQSQLNQMQKPAPTIDSVKPVSVDDVIAKIFD